jgi:hypothetical protein
MPQTDRDADLIAEAARVIAGLVLAVRYADHPEILKQVARLLAAVTRYNASLDEKPADKALRRAIARL